jgi:hypothetical protein
MKILITKLQYNKLIVNEQMSYYKGMEKDVEASINWYKQNAHTVNTVLQIGSAFIPVIGPFISAGIGLADAKQYYDEGDTKTAGLAAMFAFLPAIGKIPAVKTLGTKGLNLLASKLGKGITKLTPIEQEVISGINANEQIIKNGLNNQVKQIAQKSIPSVAEKGKNILTKVAKGGLKFAGATVPYVAADVAYNKVYDSFNPQKQFVNFNEIDINKVSQANKNAALNVKF